MNQAELIAAVAERAGLTKADAGKAVEPRWSGRSRTC
jgi:DNA-binding protein HU-beta